MDAQMREPTMNAGPIVDKLSTSHSQLASKWKGCVSWPNANTPTL